MELVVYCELAESTQRSSQLYDEYLVCSLIDFFQTRNRGDELNDDGGGGVLPGLSNVTSHDSACGDASESDLFTMLLPVDGQNKNRNQVTILLFVGIRIAIRLLFCYLLE